MMKKICTISGIEFEVTDADLKFYKKMNVSVPTVCPEERQRKRLAWRNERSLYRRKCDSCAKSMIAVYEQDVEFPVYCRNCWLSDTWEAKAFGRDFDFSRPFFDQFADLLKTVPKLAVINERSENSEFTHLSDQNKNCYLLVGTARCEDSLFGYRIFDTKNCVDCSYLLGGELCYQCLESENLYDSSYCIRCKNSQNLYVCHDCQNCKNCFGCTNLRNKEFCWGNQQLTLEEFFKRLKTDACSWKNFDDLRKSGIFRASKLIQCENCVGDNVEKAKNCLQCFDLSESENCTYCMSGTKDSNCFDTEFIDQSHWCWNGSSQELNNNSVCCATVWYSNDIFYSENCVSSHDLFGCIGMRHAEYCILNKQYSKEEYFELRDKIIKHMKNTEEWGEFFPTEISPFSYNESVVQEYFPLKKEEVLKKGWKWKEVESVTDQSSKNNKLLTCEGCRKNYKTQKAEMSFYEKQGLPIPKKCPYCRHRERMELRNPRKLFTRTCDKCSCEIQTTFVLDRPEKVYCEKCYLNSVE